MRWHWRCFSCASWATGPEDYIEGMDFGHKLAQVGHETGRWKRDRWIDQPDELASLSSDMREDTMQEREVHAVTRHGWEFVRYDRAGKWYMEKDDPIAPHRYSVSVDEAARIALQTDAHVFNRPGGRTFLARLSKLREQRRQDREEGRLSPWD